MEETISLKELFGTLRKRLSLIVIITLCATIASGIISYFVLTPIYQTSTQILVNKSKDDKNSVYQTSEIQTNIQLINTYSVIMKSPTILDEVRKDLAIEEDISGMITVSSEKDSQVFSVTVEHEDPALAMAIANKTAEVFQEKISGLMSVDNVNILSPAKVTEEMSPIKPKPALNVAIAFVLGLMVSVGIAFLLEYLDNTLKTESDIEKHLELPLLGVVMRMDETVNLTEEIEVNDHSRTSRRHVG